MILNNSYNDNMINNITTHFDDTDSCISASFDTKSNSNETEAEEIHNLESNIMDSISFSHVYNGIIFREDYYIPMIEFKIVNDNKNTSQHNMICDLVSKDVRFESVNYKCAWFAISCDKDGINKLIGPIHLNLDLLQQNGSRVIDDERYSEMNSLTIEALSNNTDDLINTDDIPDWMMYHLTQSIIM